MTEIIARIYRSQVILSPVPKSLISQVILVSHVIRNFPCHSERSEESACEAEQNGTLL